MRFSIVIPALNEEDAITSILERSLKAAGHIKAAGLGIDDVEVILVNDGSTDKTEELARKISGVKILAHEKNKGYGAAIMTGFSAAKGDLLSFLDADGTCDPEFFVPLIKLLNEKKLDVSVGGRMHAGSKMPAVRVLGNWLFRTLVNLIGSADVTDVASGMRVIRKDAFRRLLPLPTGLNFTPAMSMRAILDPSLRIDEIPMPYEERIGRSKTSVIKDGLRFLGIILDTAITYRPLRFFGAAAFALCVLAALPLLFKLGGPSAPLLYYLENKRLQDWMIFRVTLVTWFLSLAGFLGALGVVAQSLVAIINRQAKTLSFHFERWGALCILASIVLNHRLIAAYWKTGHIPPEFWVFPIVGCLFSLVGMQLIAFGLVGRIARLLRARVEHVEAN